MRLPTPLTVLFRSTSTDLHRGDLSGFCEEVEIELDDWNVILLQRDDMSGSSDATDVCEQAAQLPPKLHASATTFATPYHADILTEALLWNTHARRGILVI